MQKYITYEDKIGEIIMVARHPQSKNNVFVLVEGEDDIKFFGKFLNDSCKIEPIPGGVSRLETSLQTIPNHVRKINLIGIRDADFMHIESKTPTFPNLFLTDTHDTETMMMASDETFKNILHEFLPKTTISTSQLRQQILKCVEFLGYLRWYNNINDLELNFKGIGLDKLIDYTSFTINETHLVKDVLNRSPNAKVKDETQILNEVNILTQTFHNLFQICNGHDVVKVFAAFLTNSNKGSGVNDTRIASQLRTGFNLDNFKKTNLYKNLTDYSLNEGIKIF